MRKQRRIRILASYLATGAIILQLGPLCTMVNTTLTTGVSTSGFLLDDNGDLFGLPFLNMCGQPDFQEVDEFGVPGPVQQGEDDLMFGCPVTQIVVPGGGGDGGGGDG